MTQVVAFNENETQNVVIDKAEWPQSPDDGIWRKEYPLENGVYRENECHVVFVTKHKPVRCFDAMRDISSFFIHSENNASIDFISGTPGEPGFIVKGRFEFHHGQLRRYGGLIRYSLTEVDNTNLRIGVKTTSSTAEFDGLTTYTFEGIGPIDKDGSHCWSRVCIVRNRQKMSTCESNYNKCGIFSLFVYLLPPWTVVIPLYWIISPDQCFQDYFSSEYQMETEAKFAVKHHITYFEEWDYDAAPQTVIAPINQINPIQRALPMRAPEAVVVPEF